MAEIRLDKFLAAAGIGTRSEVKIYLKKNLVTVNGTPEKKGERKIKDQDIVLFEGRQVQEMGFRYLMLHKPAGYITATEDKKAQTVLDLIDEPKKETLFPVGRLDKDTEGLLLITDDGAMAHQLLSPKKHVDKTYEAQVEGTMTPKEVLAFFEGLNIGHEKKTMPARLKILEAGETTSHVLVTIQEGRFHQIKRMFHEVGSCVLYLKRLSMGPITLDESLKPGQYRRLTEEELQALKGSIC